MALCIRLPGAFVCASSAKAKRFPHINSHLGNSTQTRLGSAASAKTRRNVDIQHRTQRRGGPLSLERWRPRCVLAVVALRHRNRRMDHRAGCVTIKCCNCEGLRFDWERIGFGFVCRVLHPRRRLSPFYWQTFAQCTPFMRHPVRLSLRLSPLYRPDILMNYEMNKHTHSHRRTVERASANKDIIFGIRLRRATQKDRLPVFRKRRRWKMISFRHCPHKRRELAHARTRKHT